MHAKSPHCPWWDKLDVSLGRERVMKGAQLTADLHGLIVRKNKTILLKKRGNTGYQDGQYGLPSGHLKPNETPLAGAARELFGEVGIDIELSELHFKHFMFHESNSPRTALFFQLTWDGPAENKEPHKCDELRWVNAEGLPDEIIPYIRFTIKKFSNRPNLQRIQVMNGIKSARAKPAHIPPKAPNYVRMSLDRGSAASGYAVRGSNTFKYALENNETSRSMRPRCSYHCTINHRRPSGQRRIPRHSARLQALEV